MIDLRIDQQFGQIGLKTIPYEYALRIQPPNFEVRQNPATVKLETTQLTINIDYSPARESIGYRGIDVQMQTFVQEAREASGQGIERRVAEGKALGDIEKHITVQQIIAKALEPQLKDLELVAVAPIKIQVVPGRLLWKAEPAKVRGNFVPGDVEGNFRFGKIQVYLEREPYVRLKAVGSVFDRGV